MSRQRSDRFGFPNTMMSCLSLFTSFGTLLCCALPALLVTIGAGATLAGIVSSAPWLVALSKYKIWTFALSGGLIVLAGLMQHRARHQPCPIDPDQARACGKLRRLSSWVYAGAIVIWLMGFFFAFVAVHIFY